MDDVQALTTAERDALCRGDFATFVREFFPLVSPGVQLVWAPYLDLLCARLQAVAMNEAGDLIVNMPPRHLKSICVSVLLPAFYLGHHPEREVMCVSYSQELSEGFAEQTRKVMLSPRYAELFPTRLVNPRQGARKLVTVQGGSRRATSIDGVSTGRGADLLVFDDPQKAGDALSEALRTSSNSAFENVFLSRRNNILSCRIVVVMQRLHEDDFTGHLLAGTRDWSHLSLPAIAEEDETAFYQTPLGRHVFRRREGEPLHPKRVSAQELARVRADMGEAAFSAQFQQRPAPRGGGVVQVSWFSRFDFYAPPLFSHVVQSWDTASKTSDMNDYSVCTTWGEADGRLYLLHVYRARLKFPELKKMVIQLARTHGAELVLIEDKGSGTQLLQELPGLGFYRAKGVTPIGDKVMRMSNQTAVIEAGGVLIPHAAPWLAEYLHELEMFPNGRFDDQVDSTSQAIAHLGKPVPWQGLFDYYRIEAEKHDTGRKLSRAVRMSGPPNIGGLLGINGDDYRLEADGFFHVTNPKDVRIRLRHEGWARVPDNVECAPGSYVDRFGCWPDGAARCP